MAHRISAVFLLLLPACGDGGPADPGDAGPPPICRDPSFPSGSWFEDATAAAGLGATGEPVLATSIVAADVDLDGWIDFYASVFPSQREPAAPRTRGLYLNRPDPSDASRRIFLDATDESGLLATRDGEGGRGLTTITFGDLDNDGDPDAVGCAAEISTAILDPCAAFLNDGAGHFALVDGGDLEKDLFSVPTSALLDYDRDGILDFWPGTIGQWQYGPAAVATTRLFHGNGDGTFRDVSAEMGLPQDFGTGSNYKANFGITSCDLDQDGDRDVVIGDYGVPIGPNYVWRNDGDHFTDIAERLGVDKADTGGFTFSVTCGDIDGDLDFDLMTAEVAHPGQGTDTSALLLNTGAPGGPLPPFERMDSAALGIDRDPGDMEGDNIAYFADIDLDGQQDILVTSSNYPQQSAGDDDYTHTWLFRQTDPLHFSDVTDKTPWGLPEHQTLEGAVLADYDNDGDLDLLIGKGLFNSQFIADNLGITTPLVTVFENQVGQDANWTRIRLVGQGAGATNTSGIGGIVTITAGGRQQRQEVLGSWGHSNTQTDTWLTFGLGEACAMESIEVRWADAAGTVTRYPDVQANYPLELAEGDATVHYLTP
jgi:hypothetical protein